MKTRKPSVCEFGTDSLLSRKKGQEGLVEGEREVKGKEEGGRGRIS